MLVHFLDYLEYPQSARQQLIADSEGVTLVSNSK